MSLFSTLDNAVTGAASSAASAITAPLNGAQIRINTNVAPSFKIGGLLSGGNTTPGILSAIGLQYNIDLLDANGGVITSVGDKPAFSPLLSVAYAVVALGVAFLLVRGVRSVLP